MHYRQILSFTCPACVAIALLLIFPIIAWTEETKNKLGTPPAPGIPTELQLLKEEETVSIASRYEQPISQAPSNVYVITDEDIRHSGATDLPTILRRVPGLEVMQVTGADFNVSMRGNNQLTSNKLWVLVDGRSIYLDAQGAVYWKAIPVTLPEIKRIEVQKGPASVLYGFNAFDGIINIITKSPDEMKGTTVQVGGGAYGTLSSAAVYANRYKNFGLRLSYGHDQNQQWRSGSDLAYRDNKFNIQTEYALADEAKLTFSGGLVDVTRYDGRISDVIIQSGVPALGYAQMGYERPNFFIRAFWNGYDVRGPIITNPLIASFLRTTDRNFNSDTKVWGNIYNIEAQHGIELGSTTRFSYGFNYRHNTLSFSRIDRFRTEDRLGLYVQGEWKPSTIIQVVGGARYDLDTFINPTISPRGSLLFTPFLDHTFRATISVGHRPPTLFETYGESLVFITLPSPTPSPAPFFSRGSGSLDPEKIVSYEIEYQGWYLNHRLRLRTAAFYNHISGLITFGRFGAMQTGVADIYGGEASFEFLATKWLSGFGNFAYQEIGQTLQGTAQRAGPRFKYNAGLRTQWENGLSGEITYHWIGAATYPLSNGFFDFQPFGVIPPATQVGSYHLLNLRGAYRFWQQPAGTGYLRDAEVAVSAFNALNDTHKEHPLGDLIGSRVMGWLTVRY
ncbi:MAG: TonB-dependent receptor [Nitrospira sp.]|nr:TonB-dependent receptor [Nitrospira sp.]MBH0184987.1 TonB-dependent receptor [Nitrospira sp.]